MQFVGQIIWQINDYIYVFYIYIYICGLICDALLCVIVLVLCVRHALLSIFSFFRFQLTFDHSRSFACVAK